jgi:hypothetical protein
MCDVMLLTDICLPSDDDVLAPMRAALEAAS